VLPARLDAAVASTDLDTGRRPRWWRAVGGLQLVLVVVAVVGGLWLAALAGLAYLQLGSLGTPDVGPLPAPTAMLVGGVVAGLLVAFVARLVAGLGARRRARRARVRLEAAVAAVASAEVCDPVDAVLARHQRFCESLAALAG